MPLGYVWDDAWETAKDVAHAVYDAADTIGKELGLGKVTGPFAKLLEDVWNGPFRDFSRKWYGKMVLRAVALAYSPAVAADAIAGGINKVVTPWGSVGPNAAAVLSSAAPTLARIGQQIAYAGPGIARGEAPLQAYVTELAWQAGQLWAWVSKDVQADLDGVVNEVAGELVSLGGEQWSLIKQLPPDELAIHLGLSRPDVALQARALAVAETWAINEWRDYQRATDYDPATGARADSKITDAYAARVAEEKARQIAQELAPWAQSVTTTDSAMTAIRAKIMADARSAQRPQDMTTASALSPKMRAMLLARTTTRLDDHEGGSAPSPPPRRTFDLALVGVVAAAGAALWWWSRSQARARNPGLGLYLQQQQVCSTCMGSSVGESVAAPPRTPKGRISLVGCAALGICPGCRYSGMDDEDVRAMLRRLASRRPPMRFTAQERRAAMAVVKELHAKRDAMGRTVERNPALPVSDAIVMHVFPWDGGLAIVYRGRGAHQIPSLLFGKYAGGWAPFGKLDRAAARRNAYELSVKIGRRVLVVFAPPPAWV